jgi:hypothetical protein
MQTCSLAFSYNKLHKRILKNCNQHSIRIGVSASEQSLGILSGKKSARAIYILKTCGVVILSKVLKNDITMELYDAHKQILDKYLKAIEIEPALTNTTSAAQRSPGRYEHLLPMEYPFISEELINNNMTMPIIRTILKTKKIEMDRFSSVTSLENARAQHWHRDTGVLFHGYKRQLPPHGLVVLVPLVDIDKHMGPTKFLTGSHIFCDATMKKTIELDNWLLEECPFVGPTVKTYAEKGSIVIFDMRILHRGMDNNKAKRRPLLYMPYFQEWYVDAVNMNNKQTSKIDTLSMPLKKLLNRIDAQTYIIHLENKLKDLGIDIMQLQSNYEYKKHEL